MAFLGLAWDVVTGQSIGTILLNFLKRYAVHIVVGIIIHTILKIIIPKKLKGAYITDIMDFVLSFADEFIHVILPGIGSVIGSFFEPGDWLAAFARWKKEKRVVGLGWALLTIWLICGAPPFAFIPGVGAVLNIIPCAILVRLIAQKFTRAKKLTKETSGLVSAARAFEIKDAEKAAKKLAQAQEEIGEDNPIAAVHELKAFNRKLRGDLRVKISSIYDEMQRVAEDEDSQARSQMETILGQEAKLSEEAQQSVFASTERTVDDIEKFEEHYNNVLSKVDPLVRKAKRGKLKPEEYLELSELFTQLKQIEDAFAEDFNVDEQEIFEPKAA